MGLVALLTVPLYFAVQVYALWHLRGHWQRTASAPLGMMLPLAGLAGWLLARDSTLWPIPLILASPLALLALVVMLYRGR